MNISLDGVFLLRDLASFVTGQAVNVGRGLGMD
jgi:hypothetical protein